MPSWSWNKFNLKIKLDLGQMKMKLRDFEIKK